METSPPRSRGFFSSGDGIAFAGTGIAFALAIGQCISANKASDLQNKQNHVKMAVGILSEKSRVDKEGSPQEFTEGEQALRAWAVRILNENAGKTGQIPPSAETSLIKGGARIKWSSGDFYSYYGSDYSTYDDEFPLNPMDQSEAAEPTTRKESPRKTPSPGSRSDPQPGQ